MTSRGLYSVLGYKVKVIFTNEDVSTGTLVGFDEYGVMLEREAGKGDVFLVWRGISAILLSREDA